MAKYVYIIMYHGKPVAVFDNEITAHHEFKEQYGRQDKNRYIVKKFVREYDFQ